jgi:hypothetical protein
MATLSELLLLSLSAGERCPMLRVGAEQAMVAAGQDS